MLSLEEAKKRVAAGTLNPYPAARNDELKKYVEECFQRIINATTILQLASGLADFYKIKATSSNTEGQLILEEQLQEIKQFLKIANLPSRIPRDNAKRCELWRSRNKEAFKISEKSELLRKWIRLYGLPIETSFEEAKTYADEHEKKLNTERQGEEVKHLKKTAELCCERIYGATNIARIAFAIMDFRKIKVSSGNKKAEQILEEKTEELKKFMNSAGLPMRIPRDQAKRAELWRNRNKEAFVNFKEKELVREWVELYDLPEEISYEDAKNHAEAKGWSTEQITQEFLIDKKIWSLIFKRLSPGANIYLKSTVKIKDTVLTLRRHRGLINPSIGLEPKRKDDMILYSLGIEKLDQEHVKEFQKAAMIVFSQLGFLPIDEVPHEISEEVRKTVKVTGTGLVKGHVYFIRNGGLYKIGVTEDLARRFKELVPDEILNTVRCSNFREVEQTLHSRFRKVRLPQTEYFRLDANQVMQVHDALVELANF